MPFVIFSSLDRQTHPGREAVNFSKAVASVLRQGSVLLVPKQSLQAGAWARYLRAGWEEALTQGCSLQTLLSQSEPQ